jgi:hypothetical protein
MKGKDVKDRSVLHMLTRMSDELGADIAVAAREGDQRTVCRLRTLRNVIDTKYIPVACPGAVAVAGEAALAAYDGVSEAAWYTQALSKADSSHARETLTEAIHLLRRAALWPWPRADESVPPGADRRPPPVVHQPSGNRHAWTSMSSHYSGEHTAREGGGRRRLETH